MSHSVIREDRQQRRNGVKERKERYVRVIGKVEILADDDGSGWDDFGGS
jgi:hypothetical protein